MADVFQLASSTLQSATALLAVVALFAMVVLLAAAGAVLAIALWRRRRGATPPSGHRSRPARSIGIACGCIAGALALVPVCDAYLLDVLLRQAISRPDGEAPAATFRAAEGSLLRGQLVVHDLVLPRPPGERGGLAGQVRLLAITVRPSSLFGPAPVFDRVEVAGGRLELIAAAPPGDPPAPGAPPRTPTEAPSAGAPSISPPDPAVPPSAASPSVSPRDPAVPPSAASPSVSPQDPALPPSAASPSVSPQDPAVPPSAASPSVSPPDPGRNPPRAVRILELHVADVWLSVVDPTGRHPARAIELDDASVSELRHEWLLLDLLTRTRATGRLMGRALSATPSSTKEPAALWRVANVPLALLRAPDARDSSWIEEGKVDAELHCRIDGPEALLDWRLTLHDLQLRVPKGTTGLARLIGRPVARLANASPRSIELTVHQQHLVDELRGQASPAAMGLARELEQALRRELDRVNPASPERIERLRNRLRSELDKLLKPSTHGEN